jgi:hypothetical protein
LSKERSLSSSVDGGKVIVTSYSNRTAPVPKGSAAW